MDTMTFIRENWKNTARLCRESHDGNIGLPYPYFVPSITGGFNNLFYWDSYFTAQGMLRHGQEALVKSTVDDMLYLIDRYGYMPNGNAKVLMGRSQPPFLSELVRQLYGIYQDPVWLRTAYCILQKEHDFWMKKRQLPCGLNRYGFDDLSPDGIAMGLDVAKRLPGVDFSGKTDAQIAENVMADAESGWDFSPRCMGHQTDCAYVDLNAILYGMENNLTFFAQELGEVAEADKWAQAAQRRKKLMRQMLFDGEGYRYDDGDIQPDFLRRVLLSAVGGCRDRSGGCKHRGAAAVAGIRFRIGNLRTGGAHIRVPVGLPQRLGTAALHCGTWFAAVWLSCGSRAHCTQVYPCD